MIRKIFSFLFRSLKFIICLLIIASIAFGIYGLFKPLPSGLNAKSEIYKVPNESVHFYRDLTYVDEDGTRHSDQQIFDEVFKMIDEAESYILVDMFLYNDFLGTATSSHRSLSSELTNLLIKKKNENPNISIQVITDPINIIYGGYEFDQFKSLEENGIPVIITKLTALRDSNPLYSGFWRTALQWVPVSSEEGFLPNLLDENKQKLSLFSYLTTLNFKADHRKIIMTDYMKSDGTPGFSVLVTSANPHDGSSAHTNVAVRIDDYIWKDALASERSVAKFSKVKFIEPSTELLESVKDREGNVSVQFLTEKAIENRIINPLSFLKKGDGFDMAMFYISDRDIVKALTEADHRGVKLRIILDPNKDAFGRQKNGIPNRQVADELLSNSMGNTEIRWCSTHGEQCHTKLSIFKHDYAYSIILGSANLTRRNLENLNLESNVYVSGTLDTAAISDSAEYFETVWNNTDGKIYTTEYDAYADTGKGKKIWYRVSEFTGLGTY